MDRRREDLSNSRKILLTRSEPLVNLKKLREFSGFNAVQNALYKRDQESSFSSPRKLVHPPTSTRSKITVVSPKRRVRIPQPPPIHLNKFPWSNADGESAYSTDDEKGLKVRVPGDGCTSDSEVDNTESDSSILENESIVDVCRVKKIECRVDRDIQKNEEVNIDCTEFDDEIYEGNNFQFSKFHINAKR